MKTLSEKINKINTCLEDTDVECEEIKEVKKVVKEFIKELKEENKRKQNECRKFIRNKERYTGFVENVILKRLKEDIKFIEKRAGKELI